MTTSRRPSVVFELHLPRREEPALHVCHFPVPAPAAQYGRLIVANPALPAGSPWALATEALALPHILTTQTFQLPPTTIAGAGIDPRWVEADDLPLVVPARVEEARQADRNWRVKALTTASTVGVLFSPATVRRAAWAVLCRVPKEELVAILAALALRVECDLDGTVQAQLAGRCDAPAPIRARIVAAAQAGGALFAPRCVRWILSEIVAADDHELTDTAQWEPATGSDLHVMARAWFRCLRADTQPSASELLTAVWLLHDDYHGSDLFEDTDDTTPGKLLALVSAVAFDLRARGDWARTLDRWLAIWTTPDDHPSTVGAHMPPSAARDYFRRTVGVEVANWLAGVWLIGIKWTRALLGQTPLPLTRDDLLETDIESEHISLQGTFEDAFDHWLVGSIEDLRTALLNDAGDRYHGLGSLPQTDNVALRNAPIIECPDGRLVPVSLDLVAERATQIQRWAFKGLGGARAAQQPLGPLFEAWMHDQLERLTNNHTVIHERTIKAASTTATRGDAVVGYFNQYIAVEASLQRLPRGIADGSIEANQRMCERYHAEADQAEATADDLHQIAQMLGLPRPAMTTILVVTEQPLESTPALQGELARQRPDRNPRFVCSAAEFEALVDLAEAGWSFPSAVASWQARTTRHSLSVDLRRMHRYVHLERTPSTTPWLNILLPNHSSAAA